jgi:uncharacterized FlaG/YvyC family protein
MEIPQTQRLVQFTDAVDSASVEKRTPEQKGLIAAVAVVNKSGLLGQEKEMAFQVDRDTGQTVIRVMIRRTGEVVQQIPPEYVLNVAKALRQAE